MTPSLAIHLDFGLRLVSSPAAARAVAETLVGPAFVDLARLSARRKDRWSRQTKPTVETITDCLLDASVDAVSLDSKRGGELVASAEVENRIRVRDMMPPEIRHTATIVMPFVADRLGALTESVCDLARAVDAAAGYVALEASHGPAKEVALGGFRPRERPGLNAQRFRERRGRHWHEDRIGAELAGIEWGNFLGPGHLPKVDLDELRRSGAFARVDEITPSLAYLQVTEDPMDDLTEAFEAKLAAARRVLQALLMNVSAISLE